MVIPGILAQTGNEQTPEKSGQLEGDTGTWDLYNFEVERGFLLIYAPEYGPLIFDRRAYPIGARCAGGGDGIAA